MIEKVFKVIIAGGRDFDDYELLRDKCRKLLTNKERVVIVSGTANGADKLGEVFAINHLYDVERYPADWDNLNVTPCVIKHTKTGKPYNAVAGHNRNKLMSENADALICFWDGRSKGTKNMIDLANRVGLLMRVIRYG